MACPRTAGQRRPLKTSEPVQGGLALVLSHGSVARRPEVGGKEQVAALWDSIKRLQNMCFVFRDSCQILALEITFQVFLLEEGLVWRMKEGGNAGTRKEQPSENKALRYPPPHKKERDHITGTCSKDRLPTPTPTDPQFCKANHQQHDRIHGVCSGTPR